MITVIDFINLLTDSCLVRLYDSEYGLDIWSGYTTHIPEKYEDWIVGGIEPADTKYVITLCITEE